MEILKGLIILILTVLLNAFLLAIPAAILFLLRNVFAVIPFLAVIATWKFVHFWGILIILRIVVLFITGGNDKT
ncbi:MAG: hypothetical protein LBD41_04895 [Clostridiales Family XIII bacterium]|jgi:hypothetical protein|nr:hypothetical protein [Clostridiales Family XIII bacterium]